MNYLGIDYGSRRIGLAVGNDVTKLAQPLTTIETSEGYWDKLKMVIHSEAIDELVLGLPRTLSGDESAQTNEVKVFASRLAMLKLPIHMQDEAGTSEIAKERLGKKLTNKGQIDAEAAAIILQDFLNGL